MKRLHPIVYGLLVFALLALLVAVWWVNSRGAVQAVNADTIYPYVFARDSWPDAWRSWSITPAPSYPDLAIVALLAHAFRSLHDVYIAYSAVYLLGLLGALYAVHRTAGGTSASSVVTALAAAIALYGNGETTTELRNAFLLPAFHSTIFVTALLSYALVVRGLDRPTPWWPSVVVGLLSCGDMLFVPQVLVPVAFVAVLPALGPALPTMARRHLARFLVASAAGFFVGRALLGAVGPPVPPTVFTVSGPLAMRGFANLLGYLRERGLVEMTWPAWGLLGAWLLLVLVGIGGGVLTRPRRLGISTIRYLLALTMGATAILFPIVVGAAAVILAIRYMVLGFLLPIAGFTIPIGVTPPRYRVPLGIALTVWCLGVGAQALFAPPVHIPPPYEGPPSEHAMAEHVRRLVREGTKTGFADYWDVKPLMYAVGDGLHLSAVTGDGEFYWWLGNADWMFSYDAASGRWSYPKHYFIVDRGLLPSGIAKHFGVATNDDLFGAVHVRQFDFEGPLFAANIQSMCAVMAERNARCLPVRGLIDLVPLRTFPLRLRVPSGHYRVVPEPATADAWLSATGERARDVRVESPTDLDIGAKAPMSLEHLRIEAY